MQSWLRGLEQKPRYTKSPLNPPDEPESSSLVRRSHPLSVPDRGGPVGQPCELGPRIEHGFANVVCSVKQPARQIVGFQKSEDAFRPPACWRHGAGIGGLPNSAVQAAVKAGSVVEGPFNASLSLTCGLSPGRFRQERVNLSGPERRELARVLSGAADAYRTSARKMAGELRPDRGRKRNEFRIEDDPECERVLRLC